MNRFSVKMNQVATHSMNYLALGNEIFWQKIDGLYVRSNGQTTRIDMTQIELLAQERQQQLTAKVK